MAYRRQYSQEYKKSKNDPKSVNYIDASSVYSHIKNTDLKTFGGKTWLFGLFKRAADSHDMDVNSKYSAISDDYGIFSILSDFTYSAFVMCILELFVVFGHISSSYFHYQNEISRNADPRWAIKKIYDFLSANVLAKKKNL